MWACKQDSYDLCFFSRSLLTVLVWKHTHKLSSVKEGKNTDTHKLHSVSSCCSRQFVNKKLWCFFFNIIVTSSYFLFFLKKKNGRLLENNGPTHPWGCKFCLLFAETDQRLGFGVFRIRVCDWIFIFTNQSP